MVIDLFVCGALIAGLTLWAQYVQPELPRLTFFTGLLGGMLCVFWAAVARRTPYCRLGSIATLAAVASVFLVQAVRSWATSAEVGWDGRKVALLMTVLVAFCVGTLANLARERKGRP